MNEEEINRVEAPLASVPNNRHNRLLGISSRRSTILAIPTNQEEPPSEDPHLTPEENRKCKAEYEAVKAINRSIESVMENFDQSSDKIHQFTDSVNKTNALLDLWMEILEKTQDVMSVHQDKTWKPNSRKRRAVDEPTATGGSRA
ncbi:hypothetical protein V8B55DRAFT_1502128 [Mucor lusitanicus]|uniref:DASH complex subunit DUO1 n=2 Tax=Mucor circinelloides f. lusitanicus TaxID=29924 RepID=A0A168QDM0_MUCCL|nr:hypothetical protein FB192DRAFT_1366248 [Mucor lusitanicus]OAD09095.1 hypothetical protein MUCCIDRAFT_106071 [Mucor lusitanicus CBS 277.49]